MSYANGTTHYNLPQTVGTDKRDWADPNKAFADIDAAIYGAVQDTAQAALDIDALEGRMDTAEQGISTNAGNIAGLDTRVTTVEGAVTSLSGQVTDTRQDLEDMICAFNEASATSTHAYAIGDYFIYNDVLYRAIQAIAIGDTIVPDTNCTTTNVTTEIQSIEDLSGDVTQLQTDVATAQQDISDIETALRNVGKNVLYSMPAGSFANLKLAATDALTWIKNNFTSRNDILNLIIQIDAYTFRINDVYINGSGNITSITIGNFAQGGGSDIMNLNTAFYDCASATITHDMSLDVTTSIIISHFSARTLPTGGYEILG